MRHEHDLNRNRFDSVGRRVLLFPFIYHLCESEASFTRRVQAWVRGPHTEERLANEPQVIFSRLSLDGIAVGCKFAGTNSVSEDLYERYFVLEGFEKGVEGHFKDEFFPLFPGCFSAFGTTSRDSGSDGCLICAVITEKITFGDGV